MNLATAEEFRAEIARLQAEIERLRSRPCPYVTGNVTQYCTLTPLTLTDAEREAVEFAVQHLQDSGWGTAVLRGLLERLSGSTPISGSGQSAACTDSGEK